MTRAGACRRTQSAVQYPVGPPPMMSTVSPLRIFAMPAAQYPVDSRSPVKSACSSLTPSGILTRLVSARGMRANCACPPSMRQPIDQPPSGWVQLFTQPFLQKKHSPQNVSTLTATRSPGRTCFTCPPAFSTIPTNSCPTVTPGTARGTAPLRICRSLVQMLESVTRTTASRGPCRTGSGFCVRASFPFSA